MSKTPAFYRPLTRYAEFNGRSNRAEFWLFILAIYAVEALAYGGLYLSSLKNGVFDLDTFLPHYMQFSPLIGVFGLALFVPLLAVQVRRLHDVNRTGWWLIMPVVITILGYIAFFVVEGQAFFNLVLNMGQQMETMQSDNAAAMMNPVTMLKLEWPMFQMMMPWIIVPGLGGQLLLLIFMAMPGTAGANRFGARPEAG